MNCRRIRSLLPLRVGDDLDLRARTSVDDHVARCLSCFREYNRELEAHRAVKDERRAVRSDPASACPDTESFAREVLGAIEGPPPQPQWAPRLFTLSGWAAAAALLVLFLQMRDERSSGPVPSIESPPTSTRPIGHQPGQDPRVTEPGSNVERDGSLHGGEGAGPASSSGAAGGERSEHDSAPAEAKSPRLKPQRVLYWDL